MAIVTFVVKIKNPTKIKHKQRVKDQEEYTKCLNWCVKRILEGEKLSSKNVSFSLKACIKNEAIRRAKKEAFIPILNIYEYNEDEALNELKIKRFYEPSFNWLEFVVSCRGSINYKHEFDLVIGNIANDNVGETVSYVMSGFMRKEDAVERLKFEKINN